MTAPASSDALVDRRVREIRDGLNAKRSSPRHSLDIADLAFLLDHITDLTRERDEARLAADLHWRDFSRVSQDLDAANSLIRGQGQAIDVARSENAALRSRVERLERVAEAARKVLPEVIDAELPSGITDGDPFGRLKAVGDRWEELRAALDLADSQSVNESAGS